MPKRASTIKREAFTTNIDPKLKQSFRIYCVTNNLQQNEVIEKLLRELLRKEGVKNGSTIK